MEPPAQFRRHVEWIETHRDIGLDMVRAFLGLALFIRGMLLVGNPHLLDVYMPRFSHINPVLVAHYVAISHFAGGVALMLGWLTRIAALVQLPALFGAVFVVHFREGLLARTQSLELSALVFFILVVITIFGGGRLSLDHYVFHRTLPRGAKAVGTNGSPPRPGEPLEA
ncbi:MAG: DoxX family protein [Polyangiaceae bacterium]|nr:DoxX family protein [Polyangiaceae bacterium]